MPYVRKDRLGRERAMLRNTYPYLNIVKSRHDETKVFIYYQRPGQPRVRLHADPFRHPNKFREEYDAAKRGEPAPEPEPRRVGAPQGTWNAAIDAWVQRPKFQTLADNTKRAYRPFLDALRLGFGSRLMKATDPWELVEAHDSVVMAKSAVQANHFKTVLQGVVAIGQIRRWCPADLLLGIEHQDRNSTSYRVYKGDEIERFREIHAIGTEARFAFELAYALALSTSDLIRFCPAMIDRDGYTWVSRTKNSKNQTSNINSDPVLRQMVELLDARRAAGTAADVPYLRNQYGDVYQGNTFRKQWRRWCVEAGIPEDFKVHGCRSTLVTDMMNAGVANSDGMRRTGHTTEKVYRDIYGKEASVTRAVDRAQDQVIAERARRTGKGTKPALRAVA